MLALEYCNRITECIETIKNTQMETMISHGCQPFIRRSANLDGNDDHNQKIKEQLLQKYPELKDVFAVF